MSLLLITSCDDDDDDEAPTTTADCNSTAIVPPLDDTRGDCDQTLNFAVAFNSEVQGSNRVITANSIPDHQVGLFGAGPGSLNPNAISPQSETYTIDATPSQSSEFTKLLSTEGAGPNAGPQYSFGILINGVELDPIAAEPWPHEGFMSPDVNWEWNLEATNVNLGLDCNNAHVQPTGKYHYHGAPTLFLDDLNAPSNQMTLIGYAADGFPIYYKYAYSIANDANSTV
ncbi:MAG: YHYH protein, partial [Bacteroidota bacterium]